MSDNNKILKEKLRSAMNMKRVSRMKKYEKEKEIDKIYEKAGLNREQVEQFQEMMRQKLKKK